MPPPHPLAYSGLPDPPRPWSRHALAIPFLAVFWIVGAVVVGNLTRAVTGSPAAVSAVFTTLVISVLAYCVYGTVHAFRRNRRGRWVAITGTCVYLLSMFVLLWPGPNRRRSPGTGRPAVVPPTQPTTLPGADSDSG